MSAWPEVPLGDVTEISSGITKGRKTPPGAVRSVPYMTVANVQSMRLDLSTIKRIEATEEEIERYRLRKDDLLLTEGGDPDKLGRGTLWGNELPECIHQNHIFRVRASSDVDPRYLQRAVASEQGRKYFLRSAKQTTGIASINMSQLKKFPLPLPPVAQQKRIAEALDRLDAVRDKRRQAVPLLDALAQSIFLDMFGDPAANPREWPSLELGSMATHFSDGPFGSNLKSAHYRDAGIRVIRLQNIGIGRFVDDDVAYISREHFKSLERHACFPGDVLVATLGDPNIRACIQPAWLNIALNKADCVQFRPDPQFSTSEYICALLNQPSVEKMAQSLLLGQTRVRISMGRLRTLRLPLPPLELQKEFARRNAAVDEERAKHREQLARLDELFFSVQSRAFAGTLFG